MKQRNEKDVLKIFDEFQKSVHNKPTYKKMVEEVRMMKFKVRPTQGDPTEFDLRNERLIEILWSLGKLDELFQNEYKQLPRKDKGVFFRIFDGIYQELQNELGQINLRKDQVLEDSPTIEIEIFKDQKQKPN